jgi:hypothetical protein
MQDALLRTSRPTAEQALQALLDLRHARPGRGGGAGRARRSRNAAGMAAWTRCHCSGPASSEDRRCACASAASRSTTASLPPWCATRLTTPARCSRRRSGWACGANDRAVATVEPAPLRPAHSCSISPPLAATSR